MITFLYKGNRGDVTDFSRSDTENLRDYLRNKNDSSISKVMG